jgi:tetratricopeptide (TPR) repeat protein
MRRCIIIFMLTVFSISEGATQVALLDRVYDFIQNNELQRAEEAILKAEKNVATANDARTYYLKAFIYKELFHQSQSIERIAFRSKSLLSVLRCQQLDHDASFKKPLKELEDFITASLFNDGTEYYNAQHYKEAIQSFRVFTEIYKSEDSHWLDAYYFIGTSYYELKRIDSARYFLEFVKDRNYDQPLLYVDLAYLYFNQQLLDKAKDIIEEGLIHYPDYFDIQIAYLNILAGRGDYDTLEIIVEKFLSVNPENIEALLMAGTTYQKKRNEDTKDQYFLKSEDVYKKIIKIEPTNFDANYNLGVLYYNEAVDIVNKNDIDTDIDELTKVLERSTKLFEKALPLLLTIYNPENHNLKLLQALQAIYYNLNMKTELNEVNELIAKLSKGEG